MKFLLLLSFIGLAFGGISDECMRCICELEGCDDQVGKCKSPGCGPYEIKEQYWIDAGRPGGDYETCTKEKECSEETIRAYMNRYGPNCRDGEATCEDYMRMHNGGPQACIDDTSQHDATDYYWDRAEEQCGF